MSLYMVGSIDRVILADLLQALYTDRPKKHIFNLFAVFIHVLSLIYVQVALVLINRIAK